MVVSDYKTIITQSGNNEQAETGLIINYSNQIYYSIGFP